MQRAANTCRSCVTRAMRERSSSSGSPVTSRAPGTDLHDLHAAVAGGVDAGDQPPERRLPRPGRPDDREAFAGFEFEGDPVQHRPSGGVGEPDGVGVDDVGRRLRRQLGAVGFHGGQPDDAREAGLPDLEFVPPGQEFVDGTDELAQVEDDRRHLADRLQVVPDEETAPQQCDDHGHEVGHLDAREPHGAQGQRVALPAHGRADDVVDEPHPVLGQAERLDGADVLDVLAQRRGDPAPLGAFGGVPLRRPAQVPAGREEQPGKPARIASATSGPENTAATTVSTDVTNATRIAGAPYRTV